MNKPSGMFALMLAALLLSQPVLARTTPPLRVVTSDSIAVQENDREVALFRSEMPLPENTLMTCSGTCLVQGGDLQLAAHDKTVFGLAEKVVGWDLTVKTGFVGFTMSEGAGPVDFHTPHGVLQGAVSFSPEESEEQIEACEECRESAQDEEPVDTPTVAETEEDMQLVRGYISVAETGTLLAVTEGALDVSSCSGRVVLRPGKTITLTQAGNKAGARMNDHFCSLQFGPCSVTGVKKTFCFLNYKCTACVPCIPECICIPPWLLVALPGAGWLIHGGGDDPGDVSPK